MSTYGNRPRLGEINTRDYVRPVFRVQNHSTFLVTNRINVYLMLYIFNFCIKIWFNDHAWGAIRRENLPRLRYTFLSHTTLWWHGFHCWLVDIQFDPVTTVCKYRWTSLLTTPFRVTELVSHECTSIAILSQLRIVWIEPLRKYYENVCSTICGSSNLLHLWIDDLYS